jgi:hypothetical protein
MQEKTKIFLSYFLYRIVGIAKYPYLICYMAGKKKPGRPKSSDKRVPFNLRLKESILKALRSRSESERRAMNTVAEDILERDLA